jgi:hypothetical protein
MDNFKYKNLEKRRRDVRKKINNLPNKGDYNIEDINTVYNFYEDYYKKENLLPDSSDIYKAQIEQHLKGVKEDMKYYNNGTDPDKIFIHKDWKSNVGKQNMLDLFYENSFKDDSINKIPLKKYNKPETSDTKKINKFPRTTADEFERKGTTQYPGVNLIYDRQTNKPKDYINKEGMRSPYGSGLKPQFKNGGMIKKYRKDDDLTKYDFGGWIQDNKQGVIGGAKVLGGVGAMFIPGLQGVGIGLMASGGADIATEIGNDQAAKKQESMASLNKTLNTPSGNPMLSKVMMAEGGGKISYNQPNMQQSVTTFKGPSHENGGIALTGVSAEVEGEETMSNETGKVVHSKAFKITKRDAKNYGLLSSAIGKTPAEYSNKIESMFKRENDKYENKEKNRFLTSLENYSTEKGKANQMMKYGGSLTKMEVGGSLDKATRAKMIETFIDANNIEGNISNNLVKAVYDNSSDTDFLNIILQESYLIKDIDPDTSEQIRTFALENYQDVTGEKDTTPFIEQAIKGSKEKATQRREEINNINTNLKGGEAPISTQGTLSNISGNNVADINTNGSLLNLQQEGFQQGNSQQDNPKNNINNLSTTQDIIEYLKSNGVEPTKEMVEEILGKSGEARQVFADKYLEDGVRNENNNTNNTEPTGTDEENQTIESNSNVNTLNELLKRAEEEKKNNNNNNNNTPEGNSDENKVVTPPGGEENLNSPSSKLPGDENNSPSGNQNAGSKLPGWADAVWQNSTNDKPLDSPVNNTGLSEENFNYFQQGVEGGHKAYPELNNNKKRSNYFLPTDIISAGAIAADAYTSAKNNIAPNRSDYSFDSVNPDVIPYSQISARPYLNQNASTYNALNEEMRDSSGGSAGRYRAGMLGSSAQKAQMDSSVLSNVNQFNTRNKMSVDSQNVSNNLQAQNYNSQMGFQSNMNYLTDFDTYKQRGSDNVARTAQNVMGMGQDYSNRYMSDMANDEYGFLGRFKKRYGGKIK